MSGTTHLILTALLTASALSNQAAEENKPNIGEHALDKQPEITVYEQDAAINIGDMAHGPGVICLLKKHIPEARIRPWRSYKEIYARHWPDLKGLDKDNWVNTSDLFMTSSGPHFLGIELQRKWVAEAGGKPFGTYGVTWSGINTERADLISKSSFFYFRDTESIKRFKDASSELQIKCPEIGFVPDAVFGFTLLDDEKALPFLAQKDLEERQYLCVIPRVNRAVATRREEALKSTNITKEQIVGFNREFLETNHDHAAFREAITIFVRKTGMKVLLCPEEMYHLDTMAPLLRDPLPEDVKSKVVIRDTWWMPDEAASIYKRAFALLSMDCHSAIMAAAHETPVFVHYLSPDNAKYQMWDDIGLGDWSGPVAETSGAQIAEKLLAVHDDYDKAKEKMHTVMNGVRHRHWETMNHIRKLLNLKRAESPIP